MTWRTGVWLVARRSLVENVRSRTFRVVTGLLLLLAVAAVVVPQIVGDDRTEYTLATVGQVSPGVRAALTAAAKSGDFTVEFKALEDRAAVHKTMRDVEATAGLVEDTLYTSAESDGTFPVLVAQAVVSVEVTERLVQAGLTEDQVAEVRSVRPPEQKEVGRVADEDRAGVGFAVGIVLYLALTFAGSAIATAVAMEKSTRISEVLLAVLRPSQILVGNVLAVGIATLGQLLLLATPLAVSIRLTDSIGLPVDASVDLALAVAWFVLGFALYAFLFAASAALVDKITEVSSALIPITVVMVACYLLGVTVVAGDPGSAWSALISIFPISAPMAMPIRWASGEVPAYQLLLAMVLTAATALLLVVAASSIYRRALLITGRRVSLLEVLRKRPVTVARPARRSGRRS